MSLIRLTDEELIVLDGHCQEETQREVEAAKKRLESVRRHADLPPNVAAFIADVVGVAATDGRLIHQHTGIKFCPVCKKDAGYAVHSRSGRFHRKGERNLDRPLAMGAVELRYSFITVARSVVLGCCDGCWRQAQPALAEDLRDVMAEIPASITGRPSRWRRHGNRKCLQCGWTGHEGLMTRSPTILGDGTYPAGCPSCKAENLFLGRPKIEAAPGFTLVEVTQ